MWKQISNDDLCLTNTWRARNLRTMAWLSGAIKEVIVYKSTASTVWANLALEDWILQNADLTRRRILFIWRNASAVVIGRHQNPWQEANVPLIRERNIALARRRSGGGAVYHDLGNLNFTVFTHRSDYNRPRNLKLVCDTLNEKWGTRLCGSKKDDILYDQHWKVSGSSAKLGKDSAYHHFTLLLKTNQSDLSSSLRPHPQLHTSLSTATVSERSEVINLCTLHPELSHELVIAAVADEFYRLHRVREQRKVVEIDPTSEETFPGILDMQQKLKDWKWVYGKTPKFTFHSPISLSTGVVEFSASIVPGGILSSCSLKVIEDAASDGELCSEELNKICAHLEGRRWWREEVSGALNGLVAEGGVIADISNSIISLS